MGVFTFIGVVVVAVLTLIVGWAALWTAWNIHWGIRGAWNFRRICNQRGKGSLSRRWIIRAGLRNWAGGAGTYWVLDGGQHVPVDPRYPVDEREFYGA